MPAKEGLQCNRCKYICCSKVKMRDHCKAVHKWKNEQKKGRPSYKKRQSKPEQPWISGVHCQQFFAQGSKKQLFEVMKGEGVQEREPEQDMWTKVQKITAERLEHIEKKAKEKVEEADDNAEPNPWLKRVGWVRHLKGKNPDQLRAAVEPASAIEEPIHNSQKKSGLNSFNGPINTPVKKGLGADFFYDFGADFIFKKIIEKRY